ncbi:MAG TPA: hypothetical protein VJ483_09755 [Holophagaceae bacterium]|nr:hypothetical protein [Holophagaceae bacterium]
MLQGSLLFQSLGRVLRRQRLIWWIFAVSFLLAWLGTMPVRSAFGDFLDHSRASAELVNRFDIVTFGDLMSSPEIPGNALMTASLLPTGIFLFFMMFILGGVLSEYAGDRRLLAPEFFEQSGRFFWRFLRLTLVSLIPFALLGAGVALLKLWTGRLDENPNERISDYTMMGGLLFLALVALWVRAWFDLAQARAVVRDERGMFRHALRTFRRTSWRLYGTYVAIGLVHVGLVVLVVKLWLRVSPASISLSFWTLELAILAQVATRLWQRAASLSWAEAERG